MKNTSQNFVSKTMLALATFACIGSANAYDFTVTNSTEVKIVGVEASEDGKTWGAFDMGAGLAAGASSKITWDSSTDESGCAWQVRASYADGSESEPAEFDFCEEDLEIEFTE
jgi:hypothetical protein